MTDMIDVHCIAEMYGKGYGMPSSHAQFVTFFAVYLCLFLFSRHKPARHTLRSKLHILERLITVISLTIGCIFVAGSRIYLNYHTKRQVLAGCGVGIFCALAWFFVTGFLRTAGWIDQALDLPIARHARARDMLVTEDLVEPGWQRWEEVRALRRQNKLGQNSTSKSD